MLELLRSFSRDASRVGAHVRFDRGTPYIDDANPKLEADGVWLALRWALRSTRRHARRTVMLVDAQAIKGAIAKGRLSAPSLRREVTRIGAFALAGDLLLKLVYAPSEDNPADAPSRGIVRM